jgi:ADP-heptose:LPS heptosyltransferase
VKFYSLQFELRDDARSSLAAAGLIDVSAHVADFADTAALMAGLDLIISVDTAPAHLAGALGRPVWILLPLIPDWRWGLHGEETPWYPTMRLFRQPARGDWDSVIRRLADELQRLVSGRSAA